MNAAARHILRCTFATPINGAVRREVVAETAYLRKAGLLDKTEKVTCERFGREYIVLTAEGEKMRQQMLAA